MAVTSVLGDLRRHREAMVDRTHLVLRVPGWGDDPDEDPRVHFYVRFRPIRPSEVATIRAQARAKRSDRLADAEVLAATCLEVWGHTGERRDPAEVEASDRMPVDLDELADLLGMARRSDGAPPPAAEVLARLFLHGSYVADTAARIIEHSGLGSDAKSR